MTKITEDNIATVQPGDTIRYHNGYGWEERPISAFEVENGKIHADHNERADLLRPMFGNNCFIVKRAGNDYQI